VCNPKFVFSKLSPLLLLITIGLASPFTGDAQDQQEAVPFEAVFDKRFAAERMQGVRWMQDGRFFSSLNETEEDVEIRKNDIISGRYAVLVRQSQLVPESTDQPIAIEGYQFSADEKKILIQTEVEKIWRRSTKAHYYVYNLEDESLTKLTDTDVKQQFAEFSPQGNRVGFVRNNNLFWVDLTTGKERQITSDGKKGHIINGASDWVYEEEFSFAKAWFWGPDGNKIAFYRFDESRVKQYTLQEWDDVYPDNIRYKYPKAGEQNALVDIGVHHLKQDTTVWMESGDTDNAYIVRLDWTHDPNKLAIRWMNRLQNRQDLMLADAQTGETTTLKTETGSTWIEENDDLTFLANGNEFIYVSEESGYNHIYHYRIDGKLIRQVTKGPWEVSRFLGFDEVNNHLYYTSTEKSPLQNHLYRINLNGQDKKQLTSGAGWHNINMNSQLTYYIDSYSRANTPPASTLYDNKGEPVRKLIENEELADKIDDKKIPQKEFLTIQVDDTVTLNGYMIKPPNFDEEKKYPVLMYVYGGPGSQLVVDRYSGGQRETWHRHLAEQGYIIFTVDNRGTGGRGAEFKKIVYKNLGHHEANDQIAAANHLKTLNYVDPERIGIWGWSYGGYMSSLALARGGDTFQMAMAVAPVSDWRYYDTIYTERYMQTPQQNPEGYESSSVLNEAKNLKGKNYLLVHGTGDDNVHVQHSLELIDAMVEHDVQFETLMYPDRAHSIAGGNTRKHLYRSLTNFVKENL